MAVQILWYKRDLRVADHRPLYEAVRSSKSLGLIIPLYIHEDLVIKSPYAAAQHQMFTWECLDSLEGDLEAIGGALSEVYGVAEDVLRLIHSQIGISHIHAYAETSTKAEFERDKRVRRLCRELGIPLTEYPQDNVVRAPADPTKKPSFQSYMDDAVQSPLKNPLGKDLSYAFAKPLPKLDRNEIPRSRGADKPLRLKGGRLAAKELSKSFFTIEKIRQYPYGISSPLTAWEACSKLSAYLTYGVITDRQVLTKTNDLVTLAHGCLDPVKFEKVRSAAAFFVQRLIWRQGYLQQFETYGDIEDTEFFEGLKGLRQRSFNPQLLNAWMEGRTGIPYVDAIQRCLDSTGWVNMRARACLASFATMQLWLPWEAVAEHLAHQFLDFCPAIHFGQIRIASGTSLFDQLLAYNPVKQSLDQDPQGVFIRKWVKELKGVPASKIHTPWLNDALTGRDYPTPVVDHEKALATAKEIIAACKRHELKGGGVQPPPEEGSAESQLPLF